MESNSKYDDTFKKLLQAWKASNENNFIIRNVPTKPGIPVTQLVPKEIAERPIMHCPILRETLMLDRPFYRYRPG